MEVWIVAHFTKGARIKSWGQWSEEEEEEDEVMDQSIDGLANISID